MRFVYIARKVGIVKYFFLSISRCICLESKCPRGGCLIVVEEGRINI